MLEERYKRFHMEIKVTSPSVLEAHLPEGYVWVPWSADLLYRHAVTKYFSFRDDLDAKVLPSLGSLSGCLSIMECITSHYRFLPETCWLIEHRPNARDEFHGPIEGTENLDFTDCGIIQGTGKTRRVGFINNVGVIPDHRGKGLGRALVLKALHGFAAAGWKRAALDVTADNQPAVELYKSIGFEIVRTSYKIVHKEESQTW